MLKTKTLPHRRDVRDWVHAFNGCRSTASAEILSLPIVGRDERRATQGMLPELSVPGCRLEVWSVRATGDVFVGMAGGNLLRAQAMDKSGALSRVSRNARRAAGRGGAE